MPSDNSMAKTIGLLQTGPLATLANKLNKRSDPVDEEHMRASNMEAAERAPTDQEPAEIPPERQAGLVGNRSLLSVGSACQMSEKSNMSSASIATSRLEPSRATKRSSGKEKKRKQKEAERVEKLRMLVSYLRSGTSQQLLSPLALEADELELAQRYKMRLILCEDCLQATENKHQQPPELDYYHNHNLKNTPTSMIDMHHYHHQTMNNISGIASNNNDNFEVRSNLSKSLNIGFMSSSCRSVPLETGNNMHKDNLDLSSLPKGPSSFSENGADSGININVDNNDPSCLGGGAHRDRMREIGSSPHIGAVSWVLRHSVSDPGNNNFSPLAAGSESSPTREVSPMMEQEALFDSDLPRCANCKAKRSFGYSLNASGNGPTCVAGSSASYRQHERKLFYIDDLERKDSDSSDTNSQLAALSVAASQADSERCANDSNNNVSPAQSKIISHAAARPDFSTKTPTSPQPPNNSDQISTTTSTTTRSWSSEMVVFSSTPSTTTANNSQTSCSNEAKLATSAVSSPQSCNDIHQQHQSISYSNINSSLSNCISPSAQQEFEGTNDKQNYMNNHQQLLQNKTVDVDQEQRLSAVDQNHQTGRPQYQQQTSAWTNPQNLASWIDNEVNSLINDLEAKSQFISKEKTTKGSKRRWLSSVNRKGSSGALSN